jgi:hypothetical protein
MRIATPLTLLATALACSFATAPANARARVFVASYGNDANPCTFGSPCKTFQVAVNAVDAGGEVTAIDSAGFGPIAITKAVTITSPDGVEAGIVPVASGDAIDINAGPNDAIVLRGLTLNGSGGGSNGILFNSGGSLTVTNCMVQDFALGGIAIEPTSGIADVVITNTIASNIGPKALGVGIRFSSNGIATINAVVDHVVTTGNEYGISFTPNSSNPTTVAISNSVASNNSETGIAGATSGSNLFVSIDNVTANGNSFGIGMGGVARVVLGRSIITGNGTGIENDTSPNSFFTYKDNRITGNSNIDISSPLSTGVLQ